MIAFMKAEDLRPGMVLIDHEGGTWPVADVFPAADPDLIRVTVKAAASLPPYTLPFGRQATVRVRTEQK